MQWAARSSGRVMLKDPRNDLASGVRELATTTASRIMTAPHAGSHQTSCDSHRSATPRVDISERPIAEQEFPPRSGEMSIAAEDAEVGPGRDPLPIDVPHDDLAGIAAGRRQHAVRAESDAPHPADVPGEHS